MLSVVLVSVNVEMTAACECQITQWCVGFEFGQEIAFSHSIFLILWDSLCGKWS